MDGYELRELILERINSVLDPCSLAQAIPIGLSDMGLVTDVRVADADGSGSHDVAVVLRVTAPDCMYVPFLDRAVKAAVGDLEEVREISTEWDPDADWSPNEMAASARERIAEARSRRLQLARERAT